jgi:hypothetical protein
MFRLGHEPDDMLRNAGRVLQVIGNALTLAERRDGRNEA